MIDGLTEPRLAAACRLAGDLVIGGSPSESAIQRAADTDAEMRDYLEHAWNDLPVERRARAVVLALLERGVQATLAPRVGLASTIHCLG